MNYNLRKTDYEYNHLLGIPTTFPRSEKVNLKILKRYDIIITIGVKIHIKNFKGMYTVESVDNYNGWIWLTTKNGKYFSINYSDFKCYAGGNWNKDKWLKLFRVYKLQ